MVFHAHNKAACTVMSLQQFGFSRGPSKHTGPSATEAARTLYLYLNFMLATELVANEATCFSDPAIGLLSDPCRYAYTHKQTHTHTYRCNGSASELDVRENEWPQLGMVAEKIFLHFALATHPSVT